MSDSFGGILRIFLRLGLTSFGGPVAHLGYLRDEFVSRRRWIDERAFADLVALCQFLPGPASSQVGMAVGLLRGGLRGGLAAWLGFTLPSALALTLFALGLGPLRDVLGTSWLGGLKIVAVAVVARAVWGMATVLCPDRARAAVALLAAIGVTAWPFAGAQVIAILAGGVIGWGLLGSDPAAASDDWTPPVGRRLALGCLAGWLALLLALPVAVRLVPSQGLALFDGFFRAGSLVFGGGHVVLPLLQSEVVRTGWVSGEQFLAGYGAAQAVPGPLFTFSAFLGASMALPPNGWAGAALCLVAVFLPSGLLIVGALPFWNDLRGMAAVQSALAGVNAAVVGLLLAALYDPVWTSAIHRPGDFALALAAFGLLAFGRVPPWGVVVLTAAAGGLMGSLPP